MKAGYLATLDEKLKLFADHLGKNDWLVGNRLSIADFTVYDVLSWHAIFAPDIMAKFPNLKAYLARFEALPKIKAFYNSKK